MIDRDDVERLNKKHGTMGVWFFLACAGTSGAYFGDLAGGLIGAAIGAFIGVMLMLALLK